MAEQPNSPQKSSNNAPVFQVALQNFSGPFDLLLSLVVKHQLDVTELALAQVTDEFIAHMQSNQDLSQATEFLVVAATLLDIKASRLLPQPEEISAEDLELLEARDLLFARLLQYRAFKEAAGQLGKELDTQANMYPRQVPLEPQFAALLPELVLRVSLAQFAAIAAGVFSQRPPQVVVTHLHDPLVPVAEQVKLLATRLSTVSQASFSELTADAPAIATVVSRFLALLELYRQSLVSFSQEQALGDLQVIWTGSPGHTVVPTGNLDYDYADTSGDN